MGEADTRIKAQKRVRGYNSAAWRKVWRPNP
jgi:hypothetical protein